MLMRRFLVVVMIVTLGSCATPAPPPPPPAPVIRPVIPPPSAPIPVGSDWRDWPLARGDWTYAADERGSSARFGPPGAVPSLTLRCEAAARMIYLTKTGGDPTQSELKVRTSSTMRTLRGEQNPRPGVTIALPGTDSLFDAMGFSRGRFVVQQAGAPPLVVPAWAEILRVAEDCR